MTMTDTDPAVAEAEAALAEATARRDAAAAKVLEGGDMKPAAFAELDAAVKLAELRLESARRAAVEAADDARAARLVELRESIAGGEIFALAREAAASALAAKAALAEVERAFAAHQAALQAAVGEIGRLEGRKRVVVPSQSELVDGVSWTLTGSRPENAGRTAREQVGGANNGTYVEKLVAAVSGSDALRPRAGSMSRGVRVEDTAG